jgi:hypothetical protein
MAASVKARLMGVARDRGEDFNFLLTRYVLERLLYRLAQSQHAATFLLKGAMLFTVWSQRPHRATKDIDLLGHGNPDPLSSETCATRRFRTTASCFSPQPSMLSRSAKRRCMTVSE